ncbi:MAG: S8/S53 family peptidase [Nocardioides sp.]|uniref:S8/S53 family peptidase n=1 Tax=Nocardioides sp. TaxID=35761 RepID=UPI0039E248C2
MAQNPKQSSAKPEQDTRLWRDPTPPPQRALDEYDGRVLDPSTAMALPGITPYATVYVGPRLLISTLFDVPLLLGRLREVAAGLGWSVSLDAGVREPAEGRRRRGRMPRTWSKSGEDIGVVGVNLSVTEGNGKAVQAPDGWILLQQARATFGNPMRGVGLDHIVFLRPGMWAPNPGMWAPNPGMWGPNPIDNAILSYMLPGSGGRQPVAYVGPRPHRHPDKRIKGRRPVVGVLDTGCGEHPWLEDAVQTDVRLNGKPIGYTLKKTNPEIHPDQVGPLDGGIDSYSGHGTFICGLVHQMCPDADIYAWRVVNSAGPVRESDLIKALRGILALVEAYREDPRTGRPIDVLSLSLGYYHETPEDELIDPTVWEIMRRFGAAGTVVVCSAGNDATARPMFPAAFTPWDDGNGPIPPDPTALPVVSVGALNPSGKTDALFSNAGHWVRVHDYGAAVVSTLPLNFEGGALPASRTRAFKRVRESIDPDNFTGGFGVWSGTSFAAPLFAGRLAQEIGSRLMRNSNDTVAGAKRRAWASLVELSDLRPQELRSAKRS